MNEIVIKRYGLDVITRAYKHIPQEAQAGGSLSLGLSCTLHYDYFSVKKLKQIWRLYISSTPGRFFFKLLIVFSLLLDLGLVFVCFAM